MTKLWLQSKKNLRKMITLLCILSLVLAFAPMPVSADDMDETIEEDNDEYTEEDEEYTEEDEEAEAEEEDVEILKTIKLKLSKGDSYLVTTISLPDADDEYFGDYADDDEYTDDYEDEEDTEEDEDEDVTEDYEDDDTDEDWEEEEEPFLIFSSSNSKIAAVDAKGLIKAKKPGKVTITAENNFQIQQFVITVKKEVKTITPKVNEKTLKKGKTFKIKYKLTKGTYSKVTFKSSNKKVAKVSSTGKVTAKKKGVAKITLTTYNKKKASVKIIVQ